MRRSLYTAWLQHRSVTDYSLGEVSSLSVGLGHVADSMPVCRPHRVGEWRHHGLFTCRMIEGAVSNPCLCVNFKVYMNAAR